MTHRRPDDDPGAALVRLVHQFILCLVVATLTWAAATSHIAALRVTAAIVGTLLVCVEVIRFSVTYPPD